MKKNDISDVSGSDRQPQGVLSQGKNVAIENLREFVYPLVRSFECAVIGFSRSGDTKMQSLRRINRFLPYLLDQRFGVYLMEGQYDHGEHSAHLLIANHKGYRDLRERISQMGEVLEQDFVTHIHKGGAAYRINTRRGEPGFYIPGAYDYEDTMEKLISLRRHHSFTPDGVMQYEPATSMQRRHSMYARSAQFQKLMKFRRGDTIRWKSSLSTGTGIVEKVRFSGFLIRTRGQLIDVDPRYVIV